MKKTIIIGIMLIMSSFSVLGAIGHPASQVFAGSFGSGNFVFQADLTVDTNTLYVDSTNNRVGIGTTSPSRVLHVSKTSGGGYAQQIDSSDSGLIIYADGGFGNSRLYVSNSTDVNPFVVDEEGNVGIGTGSPSYPLHVVGDIKSSGVIIPLSSNGNPTCDITKIGAIWMSSDDDFLCFCQYNGASFRWRRTDNAGNCS